MNLRFIKNNFFIIFLILFLFVFIMGIILYSKSIALYKLENKYNYLEDILNTSVSNDKEIALNENIKNTTARVLADYLYPVGSIFKTTEFSTVEEVQNNFGGEWIKYSEGTTLIGENEDYKTEEVGGNNSVLLSASSIPGLDFNGTTSQTGSGYTLSYSSSTRTTNTTGNHSHGLSPLGNSHFTISNGRGSGISDIPCGYSSWGSYTGADWFSNSHTLSGNGNHYHSVTEYFANSISGVGAHTHKINGEYSNDDQTELNVINPYVTVYIYKRTA